MRARKDPSRLRFASALLSLALLASPAAPGFAARAQTPPGTGGHPDSSSPVRDPFLAPPPAPVADSAAASAPQEAVKLSTQGRFTASAPRVGDSLDYVVQVEWEDAQVPVFVLAPDSLDFPGFKVLGQATVHKKLASGSSVRNHTEFIYRLRAATQGPGKAASLKVRYLTGLSRQEEAVFIPTALADIGPAPVRLPDMLWFKLLLWAAILAGAGVLGFAAFKLAARKRAAKVVKREDLKPEVAALKNRLRSAQNSPDASKAILLEMEGLAARFLRDETAPGNAPGTAAARGSAPARFDPLLDAYLARRAPGANGDAGPGGDARDWDKLRDLFRHARFAGGYKEPHELQDAFRTFRKCLKMTGDDDHE
ncbi:MAG TPA: hypothetical protein VJ385_17305 [Fibrobacteria bacterium]|nr:hypothetical protein [Fibrobacteria bacterium]